MHVRGCMPHTLRTHTNMLEGPHTDPVLLQPEPSTETRIAHGKHDYNHGSVILAAWVCNKHIVCCGKSIALQKSSTQRIEQLSGRNTSAQSGHKSSFFQWEWPIGLLQTTRRGSHEMGGWPKQCSERTFHGNSACWPLSMSRTQPAKPCWTG